jgi:hypothetical protein
MTVPANDTRRLPTDTCEDSNSLSEEAWEAIDKAVQRLEQAWQVKPQPNIGPLVPPVADPLRLRVLVELIKVDQEHRWTMGTRQLIETYLDEWPELRDKPDLIAEVLEAECCLRAELDTIPTRQELQRRFPNVCDKLNLANIKAEVAAERPPPRKADVLHSFRPFGEVEGLD